MKVGNLNWRESYKRHELITLRENLGSSPVFGGVCIAHLFSLLCCVEFLCIVCLRPVSCVPKFPVSLVCQFLIDTSVRSNVYLQHLDLWKHILWKCRYLVTGTWRISGITFTRYLKGRKNGNTLKVIESKKTKGHTQDSQIRYRYSSHGCKFDILKTTPKDKHRYSFTPISCLIL